VTYAYQWNDSATFFQYSFEQQPDSSLIAELVAANMRASGNPGGAEAFLQPVSSRLGDCWDIWSELGLDAAWQHHWKAAQRYIDIGAKLDIKAGYVGFQVQQMKADWLAAHPHEAESQ
jgi:hypothetical protein